MTLVCTLALEMLCQVCYNIFNLHKKDGHYEKNIYHSARYDYDPVRLR